MHIILSGAVQVGKSTIIRRAMEESRRPVCGFLTRKEPPDRDGWCRTYIHPAAQPPEAWRFEPSNLVGEGKNGVFHKHPEVFDTVGTALLASAPPDGLIVMDELGFMEAQAEQFARRILALLDGTTPVLAAVKSRTDVPLLNAVRAHPNCRVFQVTEASRAELAVYITRLIRDPAFPDFQEFRWRDETTQ